MPRRDASGAGGGGSNVLRGGKGIYSSRTKHGNWVEDEYKPGASVARFQDPRFETTTMRQNTQSARVTQARFGSGLVSRNETKEFDYGNVVAPDRRINTRDWKSVTRSAHAPPASETAERKAARDAEFGSTFKGARERERKDLAEYRARWTQDTEEARAVRFRTEQALALGKPVANHWTPKPLRKLPGTPLAVEALAEKLAARGQHGLRGLRAALRQMDTSRDLALSAMELQVGLIRYGITVSEADLQQMMAYFDRDNNGVVDVDEFIRGMRGSMNERRQGLVAQAFAVLDRTGDGQVTLEDVRLAYDVSQSPDVLEGKVSPEEALQEFMAQWDTVETDGVVTAEEFAEYYRDISANIEDDDYFELMIRNAWHIMGGEGWCANSANRRVLVVHSDDSEEVVAIHNDLGLRADDIEGMKQRLREQGVTDIKRISLAD